MMDERWKEADEDPSEKARYRWNKRERERGGARKKNERVCVCMHVCVWVCAARAISRICTCAYDCADAYACISEASRQKEI